MVNYKMLKLIILVHVFHDHFHTQIKLDVVWQQLCAFSLLRIFFILPYNCITITLRVATKCSLESTGAALRPPHPHQTHGNAPPTR